MDGDKKCGGIVIGDRFIASAAHCIRTCPERCSRDWDKCANIPICFVKLRWISKRRNSIWIIRDCSRIHTQQWLETFQSLKVFQKEKLSVMWLAEFQGNEGRCERHGDYSQDQGSLLQGWLRHRHHRAAGIGQQMLWGHSERQMLANQSNQSSGGWPGDQTEPVWQSAR